MPTPTPPSPRPSVRLRAVLRSDLPALFEFQRDPEASRMAAVIPRDAPTFQDRWERTFADPSVIARAILADGQLVGSIGCFKQPASDAEPTEQVDAVGYWIARAHWNRGIATRALALLLEEVRVRPLHARVARTNGASMRVLERCGFRLVRCQHSPATERYLECEEGVFRLD